MLSSIEQALADLRAGKMVIVVDDEARENEGDLVMAAEFASKAAINFMIKEGRGLVCVPVEEQRASQLDFAPMVDEADGNCNFAVSVDAKKTTTTGISAYERAASIQKIIDPSAKPQDFIRPGHIFPLIAKPGGVLERPGHTEASIDLAKLAGLSPAGVICEIINDDGSMARLPDLKVFARKHGLNIISIEDLITYRKRKEGIGLIKRQKVELPELKEFKIRSYSSLSTTRSLGHR